MTNTPNTRPDAPSFKGKYKEALEWVSIWNGWNPEDQLTQEWPFRSGRPMSPSDIVEEALGED